MIKTIYFAPTAYFGDVRAFQLDEKLTRLCHDQGVIVVKNPAEAQLIIAYGATLAPNADFAGKQVYLADEETAFNDPKAMLENALKHHKPYADVV